jgi:hypothetical protein
MGRQKEFRDSDSYSFESRGGQSEPGETAPDEPWRYELVVRTYQEWRYVGTEAWKFKQDQWPKQRTVAVFTPGELANLLGDALRQLVIAPNTFNECLAARATKED